ncbi:hypothetical protein [Streptomyces sp. SID13031]|uniref:hypothetical protein n=1 Tax=Streptomyces sp. SID13031 TaxID=2706046 RepID=UPI0013C5DAC6|nr:hypothetical protein [Streptomyces sp. SID13031]NEA31537.1 hypothetical protein [Streptomyces sp. SID13031]
MKRAISITALAMMAVVVAAPSAGAGGITGGKTDDGGGFKVAVKVVVTSSSGKIMTGGSRTYSVPAKCWWKPASFTIDGTDASKPEDFEKWMNENPLQGHAGAGMLARPSGEEMARVVAANQAGQAYKWYTVDCADGFNALDEGYTSLGGTFMGTRIGISYRAFLPGQVPEPLVAVDDLADVLWDEAQAQIVAPTLDYNPKVTDRNGASIVNLPTWFWVTNPDGSLADNGTLTLNASVPNTPVNMTLVAKSGDVAITSAAGSNSCPVDQAKYGYGQGKSEANACTVIFDRSNAGWPVTATVNWVANWTGQDAGGPQTGTATLTRSTTVVVPVAEIQVPNR